MSGRTSRIRLGTWSSIRSELSLSIASTLCFSSPKSILDGKRPQLTFSLPLSSRNVLDLDVLQWLQASQTTWPALYDYMKVANSSYQGLDLSMAAARGGYTKEMECLKDIATVGFISTKSFGCFASDVVLYVSLVFIIGVVGAKFAMAVAFGWFVPFSSSSFELFCFVTLTIRLLFYSSGSSPGGSDRSRERATLRGWRGQQPSRAGRTTSIDLLPVDTVPTSFTVGKEPRVEVSPSSHRRRGSAKPSR